MLAGRRFKLALVKRNIIIYGEKRKLEYFFFVYIWKVFCVLSSCFLTQSSFELGIFDCKVHFCEIMSFEAINLKLEMPTDIAEEELILSHRQRLIEDKLLNCYAIEVASIITALVVKNCNGCIIDHPSQRQHVALCWRSIRCCLWSYNRWELYEQSTWHKTVS